MLKDYKVGLVSAETRISEIEYINKNSKYSYTQKEDLLGIIDHIQKILDKVSEINFDTTKSYQQKEYDLQGYTKELREAETLYKSLQNKYEEKTANLGKDTGRAR